MSRVRWVILADFGSFDETYHTVEIQVRRGWWRRKFVSGGALGQVRRVEDVMYVHGNVACPRPMYQPD